ncbi:MAG: aminotransferase class I/II-fold pyridoxal phosphate-dependent enzyme [Candidatus Caenarcaniphilales bacterium]|nr:aminotransferase class I/II-fold pyridoxal phosphate-dependent enzyme [Candidatus Caenarcaniphilales bacterium]
MVVSSTARVQPFPKGKLWQSHLKKGKIVFHSTRTKPLMPGGSPIQPDEVTRVGNLFKNDKRPVFNPLGTQEAFKINANIGMLFVPDPKTQLPVLFGHPERDKLMHQIIDDASTREYLGPVISGGHLEGVLDFYFGNELSREITAKYSLYGQVTSGGTGAINSFLHVWNELPPELASEDNITRTIGLSSIHWSGYDAQTDVFGLAKPKIATFELTNKDGNFHINSFKTFLEENKHCTILLTTPDNPTGFVIPPNVISNQIAEALNEHAEKGGTAAVGFDLAYLHFITDHPNYAQEFLIQFLEKLGSNHGTSIQTYFLMSGSKSLGDFSIRLGHEILIAPKSIEASTNKITKLSSINKRGTGGNTSLALHLSNALFTRTDDGSQNPNIPVLRQAIQDVLTNQLSPRVGQFLTSFADELGGGIKFQASEANPKVWQLLGRSNQPVAQMRLPGMPYFGGLTFANAEDAQTVALACQQAGLYLPAIEEVVRIGFCGLPHENSLRQAAKILSGAVGGLQSAVGSN